MTISLVESLSSDTAAIDVPGLATLSLKPRGHDEDRRVSVRFSIAEKWRIGFRHGGRVVRAFDVEGLMVSEDGTLIERQVAFDHLPDGSEDPQSFRVSAVVRDMEDGSACRTSVLLTRTAP